LRDSTLSLIIKLDKENPYKWVWHHIFTLNLKELGIWVISLICLLNTYSCIQCRTLTHTWHIIIFHSSMRLSAFEIDHHESIILPHKVEPSYHTIVRPYERAITGVDQLIKQRGTGQMNIIPHFYLIFKYHEILTCAKYGYLYYLYKIWHITKINQCLSLWDDTFVIINVRFCKVNEQSKPHDT